MIFESTKSQQVVPNYILERRGCIVYSPLYHQIMLKNF